MIGLHPSSETDVSTVRKASKMLSNATKPLPSEFGFGLG
jgi:hypothetical protein